MYTLIHLNHVKIYYLHYPSTMLIAAVILIKGLLTKYAKKLRVVPICLDTV